MHDLLLVIATTHIPPLPRSLRACPGTRRRRCSDGARRQRRRASVSRRLGGVQKLRRGVVFVDRHIVIGRLVVEQAHILRNTVFHREEGRYSIEEGQICDMCINVERIPTVSDPKSAWKPKKNAHFAVLRGRGRSMQGVHSPCVWPTAWPVVFPGARRSAFWKVRSRDRGTRAALA